jgi:hypothetical protein
MGKHEVVFSAQDNIASQSLPYAGWLPTYTTAYHFFMLLLFALASVALEEFSRRRSASRTGNHKA